VVTGSPDVKDFPPREPPSAGRSVMPVMAWLSATPLPADGMTQGIGACALANASGLQFDYPLLITGGHLGQGRDSTAPLRFVFLQDVESGWQDERKIDLILKAPPRFFVSLEDGEDAETTARSTIQVHMRPGDERGRLALRRLTPALD